MPTMPRSPEEQWPQLPFEAWQETYATLHLWTQVVGKIRMARSAWCNHSWQVTLYVTPRGLSTSVIPHGARSFQIDFDFVDHRLRIDSSHQASRSMPLESQSVATFYARLMRTLDELELPVRIFTRPSEIVDPIAFDRDEVHRAYDPEYANRFGRILVQVDRVFKQFRSRFIGKCSPVHFFWGAPDLAVTRFSGRPAPQHPGGIPNLPDPIAREAYSHEVSSCGFWPGGGSIAYPAFYAYAYPEPAGFSQARVRPDGAFYSAEMHEFLLPYERVRESTDPDRTLLEFLQSTYDAAADLGRWDRLVLELAPPA
jgi:hypothetical protein